MSGILSKEYTTEMLHINRSRWQWYSYINDQDGILLADDYIQIKLASPYIIRKWASSRFKNKIWIGYVTSGETLHYKTLKPVVGGLFCERIFGPINDWQCHCGRLRYARAPELPLWCKNCKVKICRSKKRRSKLGAIRLHVPVLHLWYARATKRINPLYRLLFFSNKELKKVYADEWLVLAQQSFITPCTLATSFFTRFEWRQMLLIMRGRLTYFPKDSFAPWKLEPLYDRNPVDFFEGGLLSNHSTYSLYTLLERIDLGEFARFATVRLKLLRKSELLLRKSQVLFFLGFRRIATTKVLSKLFDKVKKETKKTFEKNIISCQLLHSRVNPFHIKLDQNGFFFLIYQFYHLIYGQF
jgi:DNA-directed RNA polymerase beta' subunit